MAKQHQTTGLEIYYANLQKGKPSSALIKNKAISELAGEPADLLQKKNPGFFHGLLDAIDRPGNALRALLIGKAGGIKGLIPFGKTLEDATGLPVGLADTDRVSGRDVVEAYFGKQPDVKGKLDMADALGFIVEVGADPLWLVPGVGELTAAGKAAKVAGSAMKGAEAMKMAGLGAEAATHAREVKAMWNTIQAGGTIAKPNQLSKAMTYLIKNGHTPELAKTWAEQAAKGQRALLGWRVPFTNAGGTLVKGEKALAKMQQASDAIRAGALGQKFLRPIEQLPTEFRDTVVGKVDPLARYAPEVQTANWSKYLKGFEAEFAKMGNTKDISKAMSNYIETRFSADAAQRQLRRTGLQPNEITEIQNRTAQLQAEADTILQAIPQQFQAQFNTIANKIYRPQKALLLKAQRNGIKIGALDETLGYVRRRLTPEAMDFYKQYKDNPNFASGLSKAMSTKPPAARHRGTLGGLTMEEVNRVFAQYGYRGGDVFNPNILQSSLDYGRGMHKAIGASKALQATYAELAKPIVNDIIPVGYMRADEALKEAGLTGDILSQYAGKMIPTPVHKALTAQTKNLLDEEQVKGVLGLWDKVQGLWKGGMTVYWPAFHMRNIPSNMVLNWLDGVNNPKVYADAMGIQTGATKSITLPSGTVLTREQVLQAASNLGVRGTSLGAMGVDEIGKGINQKLFSPGSKVTQAVENNARLANFLDKLYKGQNISDAAQGAIKATFDYGSLSNFEKQVMRRIVPFYTFSRKNLPAQIKALATSPAKQAAFAHATTGTPEMGETNYYPDWWRENLVAKLPYNDEQGNPYVISSTGLPLEEAFGRFAGASTGGAWNSAQRIARRLASMTSPMIKAPTEFTTGVDMYYGKPIEDNPMAPRFSRLLPDKARQAVGIEKVAGQDGKPDRYIMNPRASWAMRQTPISRLTSSADTLTNSTTSPIANAIGVTTGFKPAIYDEQKQKDFAMKDIVQQELRNAVARGDVAKMTKYYVRKGQDIDEKKAKELALLLKVQ